MTTIPSFKETQLEAISRTLVEGISHRDLDKLLEECGLQEQGGQPRRERLFMALSVRQKQDGCGNNVAAFIEVALAPVRFVEKSISYEEIREKVNTYLAFDGLQVDSKGHLLVVQRAETLSEAEYRANGLRENLLARHIHQDVLRFCKPELLEDNYFHAVLEATKSVAQKVRERSGLTLDGPELFQRVFGGERPLLALNSLRTNSEQSEQRGFVSLLNGAFGVFRNPTAHTLRAMWPMDEQDALDLLSLASYLHRRIDVAIRTPW